MSVSARFAYGSALFNDAHNKTRPIRYAYQSSYDTASQALFGRVVKLWTDSTCLKFVKEPRKVCEGDAHPSSAVIYLATDPEGYCFGPTGGDAHTCQKAGLGGCDENTVHKIIMSMSGVKSYVYRRDSSQFVHTNVENFSPPMDAYQLGSYKGQIRNFFGCFNNTPMHATPFDYASTLMFSSRDFADSVESTPVFVTVDPRYQYLLDYHEFGRIPPTYYDKLVVNILYNCPAQWASSCKKNGKQVPKCKNFGHIDKNCKCVCPPGFSGESCDKKTGPMFPVKEGVYEIQVSADQDYDFRTLNMKPMPKSEATDKDFKYFVFVNIIVNPKDPSVLPSITMYLPFDDIGPKVVSHQQMIIENLETLDCMRGHRLLWGGSKRGPLACECASSLVNNETLENARVLRSRHPQMSMTLISAYGQTFKDPQLSVLTSQFRVVATFRHPQVKNASHLSVNGTTPSDGLITATGAAGALTAASGTGGLVGLIVAGVLLALLLCLLLVFFLKRRKKDEEEEDQVPNPEDGEGGSQSSSAASSPDSDS